MVRGYGNKDKNTNPSIILKQGSLFDFAYENPSNKVPQVIAQVPPESKQFNRWVYLNKDPFDTSVDIDREEKLFNHLILSNMPDYIHIIDKVSLKSIKERIGSDLKLIGDAKISFNSLNCDVKTISDLLTLCYFAEISNKPQNTKVTRYFRRRLPYIIEYIDAGINLDSITSYFKGSLQDIVRNKETLSKIQSSKENLELVKMPVEYSKAVSNLLFIDRIIELVEQYSYDSKYNKSDAFGIQKRYSYYKETIGFGFVSRQHLPASDRRSKSNFKKVAYICVNPDNFDREEFQEHLVYLRSNNIKPYLCVIKGEDQTKVKNEFRIKEILEMPRREYDNVIEHIDAVASETFFYFQNLD